MIKDWIELLKTRILVMQFVSLGLGYLLASPNWALTGSSFLWAILGTGILSGGAAALNHVIEVPWDAKMKRTQNRPLPAGRLPIWPVAIVAIGLCWLGAGILLVFSGGLVATLGVTTAALYVGIYTPLKRYSWLNTYAGAIPGAIPPLAGWVIARGHIDPEAFILVAILAFWQIPHFFSIAWLYKDDYAQAGFKMLPQGDPDGKKLGRHTYWCTLFLVAATFVPIATGLLGNIYGVLALGLNIWFFRHVLTFLHKKTNDQARILLRASVIYLPALLLVIAIGKLVGN